VSDHGALLRTILDAPDDDAPRLVYADWLIQRDDPRGELIQLQCRLVATPDDERRRAIRIAENKLLAAHVDAWTQPLRAALPPETWPRYEFGFERGFVAHATLTTSCLPFVPALCAVAPTLRSIKLVGGGNDEPVPAVAPDFGPVARGAIERLEVGAAGGEAYARAVAAAPFTRLRELRFGGFGREAAAFPELAHLMMRDAGLRALAASPHLATLVRLEVDGCGLTPDGVHAIATAAWRLDALSLAWNVLNPGYTEALAGPALARLASLCVSGAKHDAHDLARLGTAFPALRELDLERCQIGPAGMTALGAALAVPLARLRVERNGLGDAGALALAAAPAFASLRSLEAGHNRIGHKGAVAIASSPHLAGLERITLNEPRWKPETQALLAASPTLANARVYLRGRLLAKAARTTARAAAPAPKPAAKPTSRPKRAPKKR
jgi:uncharacterized protein (TIGR02996 family)